jgi:hypothetical protein
MKVIQESKMPKCSCELEKLSLIEEAQAIRDAIILLMPETAKDDDAAFFSDKTETRWLGRKNRLQFTPASKRGRKTVVHAESGHPLRPTTSKKARKSAAFATAAAEAGATAAEVASIFMALQQCLP